MYDVRLERKAERGLRSIRIGDPRGHQRLMTAIRGLAEQPRPVGSKKLAAVDPPTWRIRVGDYRVTYEIYDSYVEVVIVGVGHRRHVYR